MVIKPGVVPEYFKETQIGDPLYQPPHERIMKAAFMANLPKAAGDQKKTLRLHVDKMPDFSWLLTVVQDGILKRMAPEALRPILNLPKHWEDSIEWFTKLDYFKFDSVLGGRLSVPNSWIGTLKATQWDYINAPAITQHACTIDWHGMTSIFDRHMYVAMDTKQARDLGIKPGSIPTAFVHGEDEMFPILTPDRIWHATKNPDGIWKPLFQPDWVYDYAKNLVDNNKQPLILWTIHCQRQTMGACIDPVVMSMITYHHYARGLLQTEPILFYKGMAWKWDEYGAFGGEVEDPEDANSGLRVDTLEAFDQYELIVVDGDAWDKCVLTTVQQAIDIFKKLGIPQMIKKMVVLSDCCGTIPGFEDFAKKAWQKLVDKEEIRIETTETFSLV